MFNWPVLEEALAARLAPSRLAHVHGVVAAAVVLAERFGVNVQHARAAALMHDYLKGAPPAELLTLAGRFELLEPDPADNIPEILHGPVAAALLAAEGLITDPDVLAAIRWHTTGRADMRPLEMVIWLADKVEPGRRYPSVGEIRRLAETDLASAMLAGINGTILHLVKHGHRLHLATVECRNWLLGQSRPE